MRRRRNSAPKRNGRQRKRSGKPISRGARVLLAASAAEDLNRRASKQELASSIPLQDARGGIEELGALIGDLLDEDRLTLVTLGPLDRRNLPRELLRH